MEAGLECGVGAEPEWGDWKPGDAIECFDLVDRIQTLESASDDLSKKVDEIKAAEEKAKAAAAAAAAENAKNKKDDEEDGDSDLGAQGGGSRQRGRGRSNSRQKAGSRR